MEEDSRRTQVVPKSSGHRMVDVVSKPPGQIRTTSKTDKKARITKPPCSWNATAIHLTKMLEQKKKTKQIHTSRAGPSLESNSLSGKRRRIAKPDYGNHVNSCRYLRMCLNKTVEENTRNKKVSTSRGEPLLESNFTESVDTAPVSNSSRKGRNKTRGRTPNSSRKGRGKTQGLRLARHLEMGGEKPVITFPQGKFRPLCPWGKEFLTEVRIIMRKLAPLTFFGWAAVPEVHRELIRNRILEKFQFDFSIAHQMTGIEKYMGHLFRLHKYRSHVWYISHGGREGGREHPYCNIALDSWVTLCDHFDTPEFVERSERNKKNKSKLQLNDKSGTKSSVRLCPEMAELGGDEQAPMTFSKTTRLGEESGTWVTPQCKQLDAEMVQLHSQPTTDRRGMITLNEAFTQVIGTRSGYEIRLGHGEELKSRHHANIDTSHSVDSKTRCHVNIDTLDRRAEKVDVRVAELQEEVVLLRTQQEDHSTEVEQSCAQYQSMEAKVQNRMSCRLRNRSLSWGSHYINQFPAALRSSIDFIEDMRYDGHCGYRAISHQLMGDSIGDGWIKVRTIMLEELKKNSSHYTKMFTEAIVDRLTTELNFFEPAKKVRGSKTWMSMPFSGFVAASAFKAIVVYYAPDGSTTIPPFYPPSRDDEGRQLIVFGFVNKCHFVSLKMKDDFPMPPINSLWTTYALPCAHLWVANYLGRVNEYRRLMGMNENAEAKVINLT